MAGRSIQQEQRIESLPAITRWNTSILGKLRASVFISSLIQDREPAPVETVPFRRGCQLHSNKVAHSVARAFTAMRRECGGCLHTISNCWRSLSLCECICQSNDRREGIKPIAVAAGVDERFRCMPREHPR